MNRPALKQFANLWTLLHYPCGTETGEWSRKEKVAAIKLAGFDGLQTFALREFADLAAEHDLTYLGLCSADNATYRKELEKFEPLQPLRINVQLCDHDTPPAEAVRVWIDMTRAAAEMGLAIDLEVHRDTCTETPEKTWEIVDLYEQQTGSPIQLNLDLSHFAVVKHLTPPYASRLLERPELIRRSKQIHLRPFNGHHCQIPASNGHGQMTEWSKPWFDFVEAVFRCWLTGAPEENALWVCPELGAMSSGYWIPPFPDPWTDAVFARTEFEKLWRNSEAFASSQQP